MPSIEDLCADLSAEHDALDERVAGLDEAGWSTPTPAEGWNVRDQVSHLYYFDGTAHLALTDPEGFARSAEELIGQLSAAGAAQAAGDSRTLDVTISDGLTAGALLQRWRQGRAALLEALVATAAGDPRARVPWYGPPMSLSSFATARLMETWAHGTDVADALGLEPVVSDRLRHVCHIGVGARRYSFAVRGRTDPPEPVRVEAVSRRGELWAWGSEDAADRVSGPALDLALVLTQRRHRDDTDVVIEGPVATAWMDVAQAFAGPPGPGRPRRSGAQS